MNTLFITALAFFWGGIIGYSLCSALLQSRYEEHYKSFAKSASDLDKMREKFMKIIERTGGKS